MSSHSRRDNDQIVAYTHIHQFLFLSIDLSRKLIVVISLVRSREVKCASQDEIDDLPVIFCDTGALTLHDNFVGLRVGTQEMLAEHRLLKEWNPPQKLEIIYKQIHHISLPFWRAENIFYILEKTGTSFLVVDLGFLFPLSILVIRIFIGEKNVEFSQCISMQLCRVLP